MPLRMLAIYVCPQTHTAVYVKKKNLAKPKSLSDYIFGNTHACCYICVSSYCSDAAAADVHTP